MMSEQKWVYMFSEGSESMRNLLGGKGAGSAEMTLAGMPVPPGFTITTEACLEYFQIPGNLPDELAAELTAELEKDTTGDFPRELADRIQDFSRRLGNGRLKRGIEAIGDGLLPKSYLYYCVRTDEGTGLSAPHAPAAGSDS